MRARLKRRFRTPNHNAFIGDQIEQLLNIAFGWLLGLLAPAIVSRIRRTYRVDELQVAIKAELEELGFKMAFVSYKLRQVTGLLTNEFLDWIEPRLRAYAGPQRKQGVLKFIPMLRQVPEQERFRLAYPNGRKGKAVGMMEYSLPLLAAHIGEISIFPISFQLDVLQINEKLTLFNQRVAFLQRQFERSFDASLSSEAYQNLESNLDDGYRDLAETSKDISEMISKVPVPAKRKLIKLWKRNKKP